MVCPSIYLYPSHIYFSHSYSISHIIAIFQAIQTTNVAEEWVDRAHAECKDKEARRISVVKTLVVADKRIKELSTRLTEADMEMKNVEAALASLEKQAEDQRQQLHKAEEQLVIAKEQIEAQKKKSWRRVRKLRLELSKMIMTSG